MKAVIIALLATVAMAAPVTEVEARDTTYTADVCACISATGVTNVANCYVAPGNVATYNGKKYCVSASWAGDALSKLFTDDFCSQYYPATPTASCYKAQVCQGPEIGEWGKFC